MIVYKREGGIRCECSVKYNGTFLKPSYLEANDISSPTPIDFEVGDYIVYERTGLKYRLYSIPQPKKQSRRGTYGAAFVYSAIFHADTKLLELAPYKDIVISDNEIHFSTNQTITTFEDVYGIARRIEACMNDINGNTWEIRVVDTDDESLLEVLSTPKEFSLNNTSSCLNALENIYSLWKIGWVHTFENGKNIITLGRPNLRDASNTSPKFLYGQGNGLKVIKRAISTKSELATRIYAYGSTKNMITRHYNNLEPQIKDAASVNIPNLMIPVSKWGLTDGLRDARKAFVEDANAIAKYGLIPKVVYFDSDENGDVFPSIEGCTIKNIRDSFDSPTAQYYPSSIYSPEERADEVKSYIPITDSGVYMTIDNGKAVVSSGEVSGISQSKQIPHQGEYSSVEFNRILLGNIQESGKIAFDSEFAISFGGDVEEARLEIQYYISDVLVGSREVSGIRTRFGITIYDKSKYTITTEFTGELSVVATVVVKSESSVSAELSADIAYSLSYYLSDTFQIRIKQIGFNIADQSGTSSNNYGRIVMKSGKCGGREFDVKSCKYNSQTDDYTLELYKQNDDSLGQYFPNSIFPVVSGDRFVIVDMAMPQRYIRIAEARLYDKAVEYLDNVKNPKYIYEPDVDSKVIAENGVALVEGMYMQVEDEDVIGGAEYVLISSITIDESSYIPTYKVTLMDEKPSTFLQVISRSVETKTVVKKTTSVGVTTRAEDYDIDIWEELMSPGYEQISETHLATALSEYVKSTALKPVATSGSYSDLTGKPSLNFLPLTGGTLTGDLTTAANLRVQDANSGNVGIELWRGQGGSWKLSAELASFYIRCNWNGSKGEYFNVMKLSHTTGNVEILKGSLSVAKSVTLAGSTKEDRRIYFKDGQHYIELEDNGNFHFSHGISSESFITAKGIGSGGGGGGIDIARMWEELGGSPTNKVIAISHIPTIPTTRLQENYLSICGISVSLGGSISAARLGGAFGETDIAYAKYASRGDRLLKDATSSNHVNLSSDLNTGGFARNYVGASAWENAPTGASYGGALMLGCATSEAGSLQGMLLWDVNHDVDTPTRRLWFQARNNKGWKADWKRIWMEGDAVTGTEFNLSDKGGFRISGNTVGFTDGSKYYLVMDLQNNAVRRGASNPEATLGTEANPWAKVYGKATDADHADVATNADKLDGSHKSDIVDELSADSSRIFTPATRGWYTIATLPADSSNARCRYVFTLDCTDLGSTATAKYFACDITLYEDGGSKVIKLEGSNGNGMVTRFRYVKSTRQLQMYQYITTLGAFTLQAHNTLSGVGVRTKPTLASSEASSRSKADTTSYTASDYVLLEWTGGYAISGNVVASGNVTAKR